MFKIGRAIKYYDKVGSVLVNLSNSLAVGEKIRVTLNGSLLFEQTVDSIQIGHRKVDFAGRGSVVGIKTKQRVPEGAEIFRENSTSPRIS